MHSSAAAWARTSTAPRRCGFCAPLTCRFVRAPFEARGCARGVPLCGTPPPLLRSSLLPRVQVGNLRGRGAFTDANAATDVRSWMTDHGVFTTMQAAYLRLAVIKLPATETHYNGDGRAPDALLAQQTTAAFITLLDTIAMQSLEVDYLLPFLTNVLDSLNKHAWLPADTNKEKLQEWKRALLGMRASERISAEQARQMKLDVDLCYTQFVELLSAAHKPKRSGGGM